MNENPDIPTLILQPELQNTRVFKPEEDITVMELVEALDIAICCDEDYYNSLSDGAKRHFKEDDNL